MKLKYPDLLENFLYNLRSKRAQLNALFAHSGLNRAQKRSQLHEFKRDQRKKKLKERKRSPTDRTKEISQ